MTWFINRNWSINWIASILAILVSLGPIFLYSFSYHEASYAIGMVFFGAGAATVGYGGALLLQKLIMKEGQFRTWIFLALSLPLSIGLSLLYVYLLFQMWASV